MVQNFLKVLICEDLPGFLAKYRQIQISSYGLAKASLSGFCCLCFVAFFGLMMLW
ncbi:hypothetical protein [uncultured Nostoc sp.]|uniref:hypothetical protein n=1 Tax=uncultured Nostoc sp. TaxID=340711 RepID=UPI0035C9A144